MLLTRECDYAIRVVRALADMELKTAKMISDEEHISFAFVYKILRKLNQAGLVRIFRGVSGGYQLAKNPVEISLFDIVSAIDEHLVISECLQEGHVCSRNDDENTCLVQQELKKIQTALIEMLQGERMSDVV